MAAPAAPSPVQVVNVLAGRPDGQTEHRQFSLRNAQLSHEPDGRRFNLTFGPHARENYFSPRHRHNFDQVRLLVAGRAKFGSLRMEEHDVTYFPEGVFYGPAEVLSDEATTCVIQTQGASNGRVLTLEEQASAAKVAERSGTFDTASGLFRRFDGRSQDSFEALLETTLGTEVEYPAPRFHYPVLLRSRRFPWRPVQAGLSERRLAEFAGGPSISWYEMDAQAAADFTPARGHLLLVVVSGALSLGGQPETGPGTFIHVPPGASAAAAAGANTLLLACGFETLDSRP
jgi:hypothetical protein